MLEELKNHLDTSFLEELPADSETKNYTRQVNDALYSFVLPKSPSNPNLIAYSEALLNELNLPLDKKELLLLLSGKTILENSKPYAMSYGGHQFGQWAGQLGDGRAINLFEIKLNDKKYAFQLKGAGVTPYSRSGDGLAVLRSSIREFLCSEAMYHLGVPTTRALTISTTGDSVMRDILYNGNAALEQGAVVCRVAPSFIRFGHFELLSARKDKINLQRLVNYTIKHFYTHLIDLPTEKEQILAFFNEVCQKTAYLMVEWYRVGFVHGVMNTDNMSIHGLTIDYGPYGWMENVDLSWTPNTTDIAQKRYRYGNQANIAWWNLMQLANALNLLIDDVLALENHLSAYEAIFQTSFHEMLFKKIGIKHFEKRDMVWNNQLLKLLQDSEMDMTIFYRNLSYFNENNPETFFEKLKEASYLSENILMQFQTQWLKWLNEYAQKLIAENSNSNERKKQMNAINPKYIFRNYIAQLVIEAAEKKDYSLLHEIQNLLKEPYSEQENLEKWFAKRPDWAKEKIGCSQLSCSS
jgi:uncharacterized protein YdiU (UPF0061 family)